MLRRMSKKQKSPAKPAKTFGPQQAGRKPWAGVGGKPHKTAAHLMGKARKVH